MIEGGGFVDFDQRQPEFPGDRREVIGRQAAAFILHGMQRLDQHVAVPRHSGQHAANAVEVSRFDLSTARRNCLHAPARHRAGLWTPWARRVADARRPQCMGTFSMAKQILSNGVLRILQETGSRFIPAERS